MPEWIKELLISIGGGATVAAALFVVLKSIISKIVDKAIDSSFEKSTIDYSNKLERKNKAYEILLRKEFDFYEKVDSYTASLVPLVQDLVDWAINSLECDSNNAKEKYKEHLLKYLSIIPEIKNGSVLFQSYVPVGIFNAAKDLVINMQAGLPYLELVGKILFGITEGEINTDKLIEISDNVLASVALLEVRVKNRLTELSDSQ